MIYLERISFFGITFLPKLSSNLRMTDQNQKDFFSIEKIEFSKKEAKNSLVLFFLQKRTKKQSKSSGLRTLDLLFHERQ